MGPSSSRSRHRPVACSAAESRMNIQDKRVHLRDVGRVDVTPLISAENGVCHRGIYNSIDLNNCWLNVGLQTMWHLLPFRKRLLSGEEHIHDVLGSDGNPSVEQRSDCMYCSLRALFRDYAALSQDLLRPDTVRADLARRYALQFPLGSYADANEGLHALFSILHRDESSYCGSLVDSAECPCTVDSTFNMVLCEQVECSLCKSTGEPSIYNSHILDIYTEELLRHNPNATSLIHRYVTQREVERRFSCPNPDDAVCPGPVRKRYYLQNNPQIIAFSLVWPSCDSLKQKIFDILSLIPMEFSLLDLFFNRSQQETFVFRGVVCFYGSHYLCFYWSESDQLFFKFDDQHVRSIGADWLPVVAECVKGRLQPTLLLYSKNTDEQRIPNNIAYMYEQGGRPWLCPQNDRGCDWIGVDVKSHQLEACGFRLIRCQLCEIKLMSNSLQEHLKKECPFVRIKCGALGRCNYEAKRCDMAAEHRSQCVLWAVVVSMEPLNEKLDFQDQRIKCLERMVAEQAQVIQTLQQKLER